MARDGERPSRTSGRVTLVDVARDAGVSRATASLVLRGSPLVADGTRERVLASMERLGYVYNRAAASLRTRESRTVGLLFTDITNPFFAQMTVAGETFLEDAEYGVLLSNTTDRLSRQERTLRTMQEYGVDGVLLCPAMGTGAAEIEQLRRWGLPFVLVVRYLPNVEADYVGPDNALGAEMAVEHLIRLGHRRIALAGGPATSSARNDRLRGYRRVLRRRHIASDPRLEPTSPVSRDGGYQAARELLALDEPPTAVVCYNDVVAFGMMLGAQAAGRSPGEDLAVIGFDDIDEAALWQPALTTVSITPRQIGVESARLLLERIADPGGAPRQVVLTPELIVRESCGAGRAGLGAR